jgi:diamine N-acetyltransferase
LSDGETTDQDLDPHRAVTLARVTAVNWRPLAALEVTEAQRAFVAPVTYYLTLCAYDEGPWQPLGVYAGSAAVGFVMEGVDPSDGSYWIGGLLIDRGAQGRGLGRATVEAMIERGRAASHPSIALSCHPDNLPARRLYVGLGFVETGEVEGEERVSRRSLTR